MSVRLTILILLIVTLRLNVFAADDKSVVAQRLKVPGTAVSFVPHIALTPAGGFTGFENVDLQTAIMAFEIPTPATGDALTEFERILTCDNLRKQGVELEESRRITLDSGPALFLRCQQSKDGIPYRKVLLYVPTKQKLAVVQVSLPMTNCQRIQEEIDAIVASVRVEPEVDAPTTAYALQLPEQWRLAKQVGILDVYTPEGKFPIPQNGTYITVLNMNEAVAADRQAQFVKAKNLQRNYYTRLIELVSTNVMIDDTPSNLSIVSATKTETGQPVVIQYCYIFLPETTYLVESRRSAEMTDGKFEEIAKSWRLHRDPSSTRYK